MKNKALINCISFRILSNFSDGIFYLLVKCDAGILSIASPA